jgi:hypothetical protein
MTILGKASVIHFEVYTSRVAVYIRQINISPSNITVFKLEWVFPQRSVEMYFGVLKYVVKISTFPPLRAGFRRLYSTNTSKPLRILFCGSDDFSCASLRALHAEHLRDTQSILSIDVLIRPGKRSGAGMKRIREGMATFLYLCTVR